MRKIKLTKKQLIEYIKDKQENKIVSEIIDALNKNSKLLHENIDREKSNKDILLYYKNLGLLTPNIIKKLKSYYNMNY